MKKKLILGLLFASFSCLTLASCKTGFESTASKEVDTSKDFDLVKPKPLSSAKLLSQDEKLAYIEKKGKTVLDLESFYENAKNKYNTMILLDKTNKSDSGENYNWSQKRISKTIVDLKTGNAWYYEKYNEESEVDGKKGTGSLELETKVVNKNGNYIVRSTMDLNNCPCYSVDDEIETEYGIQRIRRITFATGHSNIYTSIPSNGLVLNFDNQYIKQRINTTSGISGLVKEDRYSLYVDEGSNYAYYKYAEEMAYEIGIVAENYFGRYVNTKQAGIHEVASEIYLSDKNVLDDEIDITDYNQYSIDDWEFKSCFGLPLFRIDDPYGTFWSATSNYSWNFKGFYEQFFTVTEKS